MELIIFFTMAYDFVFYVTSITNIDNNMAIFMTKMMLFIVFY